MTAGLGKNFNQIEILSGEFIFERHTDNSGTDIVSQPHLYKKSQKVLNKERRKSHDASGKKRVGSARSDNDIFYRRDCQRC